MRFLAGSFAVLAGLLAGPSTLRADCPPDTVVIRVDVTLVPPAPFTGARFVDATTGAVVPGAISVNVPLTDAAVLIAGEVKKAGGDQVRIEWTGGPDVCRQAFVVEATAAPPGGPGAPQDLLSACRTAGEGLRQKIRRERGLDAGGKDDFSLVVFCRDQGAYQVNGERDYGVVGDPIYAALYDDESVVAPRFEFPSCAIETAGPNVLVSAPFGDIKGVQSTGVFRFTPDPPFARRCFNETVEIVLKGTFNGPLERRYPLSQAQRYHATLTLGTVFTDQHAHTFGLSPDAEKKNRIVDKGPGNRGPEYLATLVLYALPHQLKQLVGRRYHGRDVVHENGVLDRIGGVVGVGISEPNKRFAAGVSFELARGIQAQVVHRWARLPELADVAPGAEFSGTAEQIPTREAWEKAWVAGVAFDLRYAVALFGRK
jgi:hypothetical protein